MIKMAVLLKGKRKRSGKPFARRFRNSRRKGPVRVQGKEKPPKFRNERKKVKVEGDTSISPTIPNRADSSPLVDFPPIINPRKRIGVKSNRTGQIGGSPAHKYPLRHRDDSGKGKVGVSGSMLGGGDTRPWESEFWPEGKCSRYLGNQDCECGRTSPPRTDRWTGEVIDPGYSCKPDDKDLEGVVNEEVERFGQNS